MDLRSTKLREQLKQLLAEADAIVNSAEDEERSLNSTEKNRIDEIVNTAGTPAEGDSPATGLHAEIHNQEKLEQIQAHLSGNKPGRTTTLTAGPRTRNKLPAIPKAPCRLRAFKGDRAEHDAYEAGQWFKAQFFGDRKSLEWISQNGLSVQNVQTTKVDPDGGFVTPDPMSSAVIDAMDIYGAAGRLARTVPMESTSLNLPKRDGGLTVYYPGEGNAITLSDKAWSQIKLTADIRATLTKVSLTLNDAALINVMDDLSMDQELILGDATSTYGGVQGLTAASNISTTGAGNTFAELTLANFHAVVAALPQKFHANATWLMSRAGYAESAERLAYAGGGNTVSTIAGGSGRSFLGYPVDFSDQMPAEANDAVAAYFGDFSFGVVIGQFGGIQVSSSEHYAFNEGVLTVRGFTQYDMVLTDYSATGAFSRLVLAGS